ncbi:MAG: tRNA1(Val) (adenine(37)-N6)-methyltransferase [Lachnospiraceae bacterium]|nr:tRNA1(Val) (adenine(37)-N6)-methyltransferase [Lachnospiraceae bacterium]
MPKDPNWNKETAPVPAEGERLDKLGRKGYRIIQNTKTFCFGIDAVLLADFARISPKDTVLDLGCGNGILPLLLAARGKGSRFTGIEIQEQQAELARRNAALNGLQDRFEVLSADLRQLSAQLKAASFDAVISNPPYMKKNSGLLNPESAKAIARHEICCELEDILREASRVLKTGGSLFLVYRCWRMAELLAGLPACGLAAKRLRPVYSSPESEGELVLLEARKGGAEGLTVLPPLILYESPGVFSREVMQIYRDDPVLSKEEET